MLDAGVQLCLVSSGNCSHDAPCEWLWVVLGACRGEGQVCQLEFRAHGHSGRASRRNEEGGQKFQEAVCRSLRFLVVSKEDTRRDGGLGHWWVLTVSLAFCS